MTDVLEAVDETRSLTLLNTMGDIEVTWDSSEDDAMHAIIDKKMKEGVRFFILKPFPGGFLYRKTAMKTMADLKDNRVKFDDKDLEAMFEQGKIQAIRSTHDNGQDIQPVGVANDPGVAARSRTVGIKAFSGG